MKNRNLLIICRNRNATLDIKRSSMHGLLMWGSHLKQKYFSGHISQNSSPKSIKARVFSNFIGPEWIGGHRCSVFDLLNYVINDSKYVYEPSSNAAFFDPVSIPTITSLHMYDHLLKSGYSPVYLDNFEMGNSKLKKALSAKPLAVMISASYLSASEIYSISDFIHKFDPDMPVIVGSSFLITRMNPEGYLIPEYEKIITKNTYMILEHNGLDTASLLLDKIYNRSSVSDLPNIVYFDNDRVNYTEKKSMETDINSVYPQWTNLSNISGNVAFIRASEGCAFNCKFCTHPGAVTGYRHRSIESLCEELKQIHKSGIQYLAFTDDHFAINQNRIKEICNMMLKENFNFKWFAGIRSNSITDENAELLAKAGCRIICIGIESGDDRILRLMNKQTTSAGNLRCIELLEKHGIMAYGSFILGFPGETEESIETTIRWINNSPLKLYKVFLFHLFPGSPIYDERDAHSITFFGDKYDAALWKTPTLDVLRASEMIRKFVLGVEKAALIYNYSPMYAFFPFVLKDYSFEEGLKFMSLHTELVKNELSKSSFFLKRKILTAKLKEIRALLKHDMKDLK